MMQVDDGGKILANAALPYGKSLVNVNGETVFQMILANGSAEHIYRQQFNSIAKSDFPPLIRLVDRGTKSNVILCYIWIDTETSLIKWQIGELTDTTNFSNIAWKEFSQIPGIKNKGLGNQGGILQQAWFEASRRWVNFLEKAKYKLMYPQDEVIGNQIYFSRSTEPELLTRNFKFPEAMLAQTYEENRFPSEGAIWQYKYDGKRNMVGVKEGEVLNISRGRKQAKSNYAAIKDQALLVFTVIEERLGSGGGVPTDSNYWLDGEIYVHGFSFQKLMTATQASVNESHNAKELCYIVYDLIDDGTTKQITRLQFLELVFQDPRVKALPNIKLAPWEIIRDRSLIFSLNKAAREQKYEGLILRNPNGLYVEKRTYDILKVKSWITEEWYIVGAKEATGTHRGCVKWILNSKKDGTGLKCKGVPAGPEIGTLESRRQQLLHAHMFMGVTATITFFEKSDKGKPRFPNVIAYNRTDM